MDLKRTFKFEADRDPFDEGWQSIRVGLDHFAATLFGKVDHITVRSPNRWVRQGQKLMTITFDGVSVDLPSPVEGTVISVNGPALETPDVVTDDPLREGWLAVIKAQASIPIGRT